MKTFVFTLGSGWDWSLYIVNADSEEEAKHIVWDDYFGKFDSSAPAIKEHAMSVTKFEVVQEIDTVSKGIVFEEYVGE
jgi:hypothetical protein